MKAKMSFSIKFIMLTSLFCFTTASATTKTKAKKFKQIYVMEDSWVSSEIAALDNTGRLNG